MIRFLYTGSVNDMKKHSKDLLYAAEKYKIENLKMECIKSLTRNLDTTNLLETLLLAERHNSEILFKSCVKFMKKKGEKVFSSPELLNSGATLDMNLMMVDDGLDLDEFVCLECYNNIKRITIKPHVS
jgi:hypothetical protein